MTLLNDPTAHAEIMCIREACKKLDTFSLQGHTLYTSCEPYSMCLSACYWAHISKIVYGNTKEDANNIGFDDEFIYKQLALPDHLRLITTYQAGRNHSIQSFEEWNNKQDKVHY